MDKKSKRVNIKIDINKTGLNAFKSIKEIKNYGQSRLRQTLQVRKKKY